MNQLISGLIYTSFLCVRSTCGIFLQTQFFYECQNIKYLANYSDISITVVSWSNCKKILDAIFTEYVIISFKFNTSRSESIDLKLFFLFCQIDPVLERFFRHNLLLAPGKNTKAHSLSSIKLMVLCSQYILISSQCSGWKITDVCHQQIQIPVLLRQAL